MNTVLFPYMFEIPYIKGVPFNITDQYRVIASVLGESETEWSDWSWSYQYKYPLEGGNSVVLFFKNEEDATLARLIL